MEDNEPAVRRVVVRRRVQGFSASSSTELQTLRATSAPSDEVDDAIDPDTMTENIRRGHVPGVTADPPVRPTRDTPASRVHQAEAAGSRAYAKEYRLGLINRLLMRNIPLDQIARELQVSLSTVEKDRAELKKRLRQASTEMNIDELIGTQNSVYDEIAGMAMRIASAGAQRSESGEILNPVPTPMRLAAMRTALAANADRTRFLASAGVFEVLKFRRSESGDSLSDVQALMARTSQMLEELSGEDVPHAPPPGSFRPMTFDDVDASSSTNEIQEL